MKTKIFNALKTSYAHLGLGDEILQEHAGALAALGLVTDDNLSAVVSAQSDYLSKLQKLNDKRVTDAVAKATKEKEDAAKKAAEEAEAKKKAEEEAKAKEEAEKKAAEEAEAKKKADEEAARKKEEELKKNELIPDAIKKILAEQAAEAKAKEEAYQAKEAAMKAQNDAILEQLKKLAEVNEGLSKGYEQMKKDTEAAKAAQALAARKDFIQSEAKRLNIPQYRIDEGFVLGDDLDNSGITEKLTEISNNIKNNQMPGKPTPFQQAGDVSKEEMDQIANILVR